MSKQTVTIHVVEDDWAMMTSSGPDEDAVVEYPDGSWSTLAAFEHRGHPRTRMLELQWGLGKSLIFKDEVQEWTWAW